MNQNRMEIRPRMHSEKEHKVVNVHYRKAILQAIEELHDFQLRSNVDAIRRHVQSSIELNHQWNETVFLKTLKAVVHDGEIEQCTTVNCALSPEYKRRRAYSLSAILEKSKNNSNIGAAGQQPPVPLLPESNSGLTISIDYLSPSASPCLHSNGAVKSPPKRKAEHEKWKILPKKIYDKAIIVNPMDTH